MQSKSLLSQLREASPLISVGILTADLMSLGSELKLLEDAGVKLLHVDVMDASFCPMAIKTPLENAKFMISAVNNAAQGKS